MGANVPGQWAAWVTFIVLLVSFGLGTEHLGILLLTLLLGGMVAVVLSYPILITLERPVRITPEQALRDYYGSLSHHLPHFRRMWLLLSTADGFDGIRVIRGIQGVLERSTGHMRKGHAGSIDPAGLRSRRFQGGQKRGQDPNRCGIHPENMGARSNEGGRDPRHSHGDRARARARTGCGTSRTERWAGKVDGQVELAITLLNRARRLATTASEMPGRPRRKRPSPKNRVNTEKHRIDRHADVSGDGDQESDRRPRPAD